MCKRDMSVSRSLTEEAPLESLSFSHQTLRVYKKKIHFNSYKVQTLLLA